MAHSGHNKKSRYNHSEGGQTESHGRFLGFYEKQTIEEAADDTLFVISHSMENRPDLIANKFYGEPRYMWIILMRNNINNPLTDLLAGNTIYIPSITRVRSNILS